MNVLKLAVMVFLLDVSPAKADDFSISVTDGLGSGGSSLTAPVRYVSKKERNAARAGKGCITTTVKIDGVPGDPVEFCSPLNMAGRENADTSWQGSLPPFNPGFDLSNLGF